VVSRLQRLLAANKICRRQNPVKMNFPYGHRISKKYQYVMSFPKGTFIKPRNVIET